MGFRFLHVADLHLETSFGGSEATREALRRETHAAFARAVDWAIAQDCDALLAAGDLFDDPILSVKTELFFASQLKRLAQAGVWFLAACGNHDPGGDGFRTADLGVEGERVRFFRGGEPETLRVTNREGAAVALVVGAGHASAHEATNLAARFPQLSGALPVVGLLHTSIESAKSAADHDRYAPSTRADYERLAYAYWALGHIHLRQQPLPGLPVHYAGNLLGRNPRETGAKGGLAVEAFAGASAEPRFVRFARVRWERVKLAVPPACRSLDELAAALARALAALPRDADERLALRLEFSGETPLAQRLRSPEERTQLADELAGRSGALELQLRADGVASPLDRTRLRATPSVLADAFALIERAQADDALLAELAPAELALTPASEAERVAYLRELLADLPEELTLRGLEREGA